MTAKVLAITADLFLQSRIIELAAGLGSTAKIVTTENDLIGETKSYIPSLVILDLASSDYDAFSCAGKLKAMARPPKILAIFPHLRTDLRLRAQDAKIDYIVPNSGFLNTLKTILEKEAVHD